jgi:uncharacterized membrane protein YfcA
MTNLGIVLLGFVIGVLVGATGIGGGTLLAPALIFFLRVNPFVSVGTDLFVSAITKLVGAVMHRRANNVYREILWPLCISGFFGALLGTLLLVALKLHMDPAPAQALLRRIIGVVLFVCAAFIILTANERFRRDVLHAPRYAAIIGPVVAIVTTLTGVGVGALSVPALYLISGRRPMAAIVGSSLVFGTVVTLVGALAHVALRDVNYSLALWLIVGGIPGVALGSALTIRKLGFLQPVVAVLLIVSGVRLLM